MDPSGRRHPVQDAAQLLKVVGSDLEGRVILVWGPQSERMVLPEEWAGAEKQVEKARSRRLEADCRDGLRRLAWMSAAWLAYALYLWWQAWSAGSSTGGMGERLLASLDLLRRNSTLGLALLGWLVVGFIPWYQSFKGLREWRLKRSEGAGALIPGLRFDTWLDLQRAPLTRALAGVLGLVWVAQWMSGPVAIPAAGLLKAAYHAGEWWRLLTAPWLHGNLLHLALNLLALLYLGKRVELFARWPHLLTVLLFASLAGGIFSAHTLQASSIGISGGLMGWLGFLLVFESLHSRLVPRLARRRLLGGVLLTALIGALGYRFIDNAAHAGGLVAGMAYAWIVFPGSASIHRPRVLGVDRMAGALAGLILIAGVGLCLLQLARS